MKASGPAVSNSGHLVLPVSNALSTLTFGSATTLPEKMLTSPEAGCSLGRNTSMDVDKASRILAQSAESSVMSGACTPKETVNQTQLHQQSLNNHNR